MRVLAAAFLSVVCLQAWAQRSDGQPSPAVREQQRQAEHARKQHKKSKPKPQERAAVKMPGDKSTKPPRSKPGQAAIKTP